MDYKNAGVDIEAGYKSVEFMKEHIARDHETGSTGRNWRILRCIFHEDFKDMEEPVGFRNRWMRNEGKACHDHGQA